MKDVEDNNDPCGEPPQCSEAVLLPSTATSESANHKGAESEEEVGSGQRAIEEAIREKLNQLQELREQWKKISHQRVERARQDLALQEEEVSKRREEKISQLSELRKQRAEEQRVVESAKDQ